MNNKKPWANSPYKKNERWEIDIFERRGSNGSKDKRIILVDCGTRCGLSVSIVNSDIETAIDRLFKLAIKELGRKVDHIVADHAMHSNKALKSTASFYGFKLIKTPNLSGKLTYTERFIKASENLYTTDEGDK